MNSVIIGYEGGGDRLDRQDLTQVERLTVYGNLGRPVLHLHGANDALSGLVSGRLQRDLTSNQAVGLHELLLRRYCREVRLHGRGRLQRTELRHLSNEVCIGLWVHWILRPHLGDQQLQKVILAERLGLHRQDTRSVGTGS